ncbi:hypothetical protein M6B38_106900 [Iris pallida]|uniref:Uncharacterized protein n=1 Tax=Iris pallida TaxID=29817 RepID=A0AAX6ES64_IRIPA|nr:hypothetical protein M6B38_106900 [Iris pallida]
MGLLPSPEAHGPSPAVRVADSDQATLHHAAALFLSERWISGFRRCSQAALILCSTAAIGISESSSTARQVRRRRQRSVLRRRTGTLMITRTRRRAGLRLRHFFGDVSFSDRSNPVSLDRLSVGLIGAHRSDPSDDGTD